MFLAWKEIRHGKGKFALIVAMIALIGYLAFFLTSLAYGLASSYTNGIDGWGASAFLMTEDANDNSALSLIPSATYDEIALSSGAKAKLGLFPSVIKSAAVSSTQSNVYVFGVEDASFLLSSVVSSGTLGPSEAIGDFSLQKDGYALGDAFTLVGSTMTFTLTGFTSNATFQTAPIVYLNLASFDTAYGLPSGASSLVIVHGTVSSLPSGLKSYSHQAFVNSLPGYGAQVATFSLMIGFLVGIASFVLGVFMYVLTMQKVAYFGVMKVQGLSNAFIAFSVVEQSLLLTVFGVAIGLGLTLLSGLFLAGKMPFAVNTLFFVGIAVAFLIFSVLGALFSVRAVLKIDPLQAIS
jgi:putative ABC transport system permease protein